MTQRDRPNHRDWYAVLGVERSATFLEIRTAYRRHALALHAERLHSTETTATLTRAYDKLNELGAAYRALRHPETRRAYDRVLEGHSAPVQEPAQEGRPTRPRYATRVRQSGRPSSDKRRLGRIMVILGFGLLVLWAVVTSVAERRQAAASMLSGPPSAASRPVPER